MPKRCPFFRRLVSGEPNTIFNRLILLFILSRLVLLFGSWSDTTGNRRTVQSTILETQIRFVLRMAKFLQKFEKFFNERQKKVILRMFKAGSAGFEGGMNARKYLALAKISKATATRDLRELVKMGAIQPEGEGRSVRYHLAI